MVMMPGLILVEVLLIAIRFCGSGENTDTGSRNRTSNTTRNSCWDNNSNANKLIIPWFNA